MNPSYVRAATAFAVMLALAGLVMLLSNRVADSFEHESPAAVEFRCGYEAQRAGIDDPVCDEVTRPVAPSKLRPVDPAKLRAESLRAESRHAE